MLAHAGVRLRGVDRCSFEDVLPLLLFGSASAGLKIGTDGLPVHAFLPQQRDMKQLIKEQSRSTVWYRPRTAKLRKEVRVMAMVVDEPKSGSQIESPSVPYRCLLIPTLAHPSRPRPAWQRIGNGRADGCASAHADRRALPAAS